MIIGDHNPDMTTQEYWLSLIQDSFPEVKLNNANAFGFFGRVDQLQNTRVLYGGYWTIHYDSRFVRNIQAFLFGEDVVFHSEISDISETNPIRVLKFKGPVSYWSYENDNPFDPVKCTFWGFRFEVDNVPAPAETPIPPQVYGIAQFWYVVDGGYFDFLAVLAGGEKLKLRFPLDSVRNGCYDLGGSVLISQAQEVTMYASEASGCPSLGLPTKIDLDFPNDYGVRLEFDYYVEDLEAGTAKAYYKIVKDRPNLFFVASMFGAVGVPYETEVYGDTAVCTVFISFVDSWTEIHWTVSNAEDFLYSTFSHTFVRNKGFTGFNSVNAKYQTIPGNPCASSVKTVYLRKPATSLGSGVIVYPQPNSSIPFPIATNAIAAPGTGGVLYALESIMELGSDKRYNRIGPVLGNC